MDGWDLTDTLVAVAVSQNDGSGFAVNFSRQLLAALLNVHFHSYTIMHKTYKAPQRLRVPPLVLLAVLYVVFVVFQCVVVHRERPGSPANNVISLDIVSIQQGPQARQHMRQAPERRRIMVFIVNFRDTKRCAETLQTMFANAVHPELLRVSIHDQIYAEKGDLTCVEAYCQLVGKRHCRREQIHSTAIDAKDAAGPTVARAITEKALADEEFCLGLDSHIVFMPKWDDQLIANWAATNNEKAILTIYPKSTEYLTDHSKDHQMGVQCQGKILSGVDAMVQYQSVTWFDKTDTTKPRLQTQFAGGFNFGSCQAYKEVPNDPYTPILFYGEEYARAARLWTWGYDFYAPSVDVVYHWFEDRPRIWSENWESKYPIMQRSQRRVRFLLGLPVSSDDFDRTDLDKYTLGTKRTFEQWKEFSRIDPTAQFTDDRNQFNSCGDLELVPYSK